MDKKVLQKIESATDEALKISMIKMLVFQELKSRGHNESVLKDKINEESNKFYEISERDLKNPNSFNLFIEKLSNKILSDLRKPKFKRNSPTTF